MAIDLTNRVALVTGGARGIGRAISLALAEAGASVIVNYDRRRDDAVATVEELVALGRRAIAIGADVSRGPAVSAMVAEVTKNFGTIDILVNNAGIAMMREVDAWREEDLKRAMAVDLKSAFLCMQAVLPTMRERRWGRIVNISPGAAYPPGLAAAHDNASRTGMEGLTRGFAARLARDGITVNAVTPALVDADMLDEQAPASAQKGPSMRLGMPDAVAQAVLMVIGNVYMTGQSIRPVGGIGLSTQRGVDPASPAC